MDINTKNMICPRCIWVVECILNDLGIEYVKIKLGEVITALSKNDIERMDELNDALNKPGLELFEERKVQIVEQIKGYDNNYVSLFRNYVNAAALIWTAGVKGTTIKGLPSDAKNKHNRIMVNGFSRIHSLDNVFAIGDTALMKTEKYPYGHPMVAQTAIQQGKTLAENLMRQVNKEPLKSFGYRDKGSMATIGKKKAVVTIKEMEFSGFFAWLIWSFIYLMSIMGVRNKILVAINWLWSYFTYDKGDRVIIRRYEEEYKKEQQTVFIN